MAKALRTEESLRMNDFMTDAQRSRAMSKVRGQNTKPEIKIRSGLHRQGFRFRVNNSKLPGRPDIALKKYSVAIFIHGCFWHCHINCPKSKMPQTRAEFWKNKISNNVIRDQKNIKTLSEIGWRIAVVWECGIKKEKDLIETLGTLNRWIKEGKSHIELPQSP